MLLEVQDLCRPGELTAKLGPIPEWKPVARKLSRVERSSSAQVPQCSASAQAERPREAPKRVLPFPPRRSMLGAGANATPFTPVLSASLEGGEVGA
jgi:hypothetical protein